jgi:membrane-bound metal-dependent hydrolase YbcI (DUF457 family)
MDSLFHFVFAFIAGLAIGLHKKHSIRTLALLSFAAILIDVDHFFPSYPETKVLHNLFVTFLLPLLLFIVSFYYEKGRSIRLQSYALILLAMLTGHLAADFFDEGGEKILYPLSDKKISLPNSILSIHLGDLITRSGIALLIYGFIILSAHFVEDFIYLFERKHEKLKKALKDVFSEI